jgi:hypothetical protein
LTDPSLRSPDGRVSWTAPFFQVLALSYKPGHQIIAWPDNQRFDTPDGPVTVTSDGLRASLVHDEDTVLRSNVEATVLNIETPEQTIAMAGVNAALQKVELAHTDYRIALSIDSIAVPKQRLSGSAIPEALGSVNADMSVSLEAPLTMDASSVPALTSATVRSADLRYGDVTLKLTGNADFDARGRATGEVTLSAEDWPQALQTARDRGDLPEEVARGLQDILSLLATISGAEDTLDVTLRLDKGTIRIGPLPVGELPPLPRP